MAYRCVKNTYKECDGCMACRSNKIYYCPCCGNEVYETVYVDMHYDVIGCDQCVHPMDLEEVMEYEIN